MIERTLAEPGLAPASIYFRYYLHRAAVKAGLGDRYLDFLDTWRQQLALGVTTWPERIGFRVRSDCHAWGSSPNIEVTGAWIELVGAHIDTIRTVFSKKISGTGGETGQTLLRDMEVAVKKFAGAGANPR